jgi:AraC-like DNA-binding protein
MKHSHVLYLLFILAAACFAQTPTVKFHDTSLYYYTSPQPLSVITTDFIKISIPKQFKDRKVIKTWFYAQYQRYLSTKFDHSKVDTLLHIDSVPPFETIWNCAHVPDQALHYLRLVCRFMYQKGALVPATDSFYTLLILDRNQKLNDKEWISNKTSDSPEIDGRLDDWPLKDSIVFKNNDNLITGYSQWDRKNLYFAVIVQDKNIFPQPQRDTSTALSSFMIDGIEFFFDTNHDHNPVRGADDLQMIIPVNGSHTIHIHGHRNPGRSKQKREAWKPEYSISVVESVYIVEAAFPFSEFDFKAEHGAAIGLNLVNSDREEREGLVMTASWAGISDLLNHNPSEWANLRLVDPGRYNALFYLLGALIIIGISGSVILIKRKNSKAKEKEIEPSRQAVVIVNVKAYIQENFNNESLNLNFLAAEFDMNPDYLGKLFKREVKTGFNEYLNKLRIEKSKPLLIAMQKKVTDIAFEVGYGSLAHYNKIFKKFEKITPTQYQINYNKPKI